MAGQTGQRPGQRPGPPRTAAYRATRAAQVLAEQGRMASWLARRCGVSKSHLSRVLAGERPATAALAEQVAAVLGIPLFFAFDFLEREDSSPASDGEAPAGRAA